MSIKVLVTGANGQLGKTFEELFANNKDNIEFSFVAKAELDITNKQAVADFFGEKQFDYCINCAAYTNVEQAEKTPEPAYLVNGEAVKYLAVACRENNVVLIHISTDYVFDGKKNQPYAIHDKTNPINEYGKSKLLGEQYIAQTIDTFFIIRTSWLYSKKYGKNFYKAIIDKAKTEESLSIITSQKGCPTDTVSLSKFVYNLIEERSRAYGLYHFSDEEEMTWYDFAKKILIENGLLGEIKLVKADNYVTFAKRPKYSVLAKNSE